MKVGGNVGPSSIFPFIIRKFKSQIRVNLLHDVFLIFIQASCYFIIDRGIYVIGFTFPVVPRGKTDSLSLSHMFSRGCLHSSSLFLSMLRKQT